MNNEDILVGVDLSFIKENHKNPGGEQYILNLMSGFEKNNYYNFIFFVSRNLSNYFIMRFPLFKFVIFENKNWEEVNKQIFRTFVIPKLIKKYDIQLMFFPSYKMGVGYKKSIHVPIVVTPHDIQFKYYKRPGFKFIIQRIYLDWGYKNAFKNAKEIICISKYVMSTFLNNYSAYVDGKLNVIYNPINFDYSKLEPIKNISNKYILSVSSIQKHKNMITLIQAYELIKDKIEQNLLITGPSGTAINEVTEYVNDHHLNDRIKLLGRKTDEELKWLYVNADLYVTTSLYEGFGMTPIEAMGAGVKVISSKCTSLFEVTRGLCLYYNNAESALELSKCIESALQNSNYNTEEIKKEVIDIYNYKKISLEYYNFFQRIVSEE